MNDKKCMDTYIFLDCFLTVLRGSESVHFCDPRSRTARNLALDYGSLVLFAALLARGRPEIDLDYIFKAKKVTLRQDSGKRKSPGRQKGSVHRFIC